MVLFFIRFRILTSPMHFILLIYMFLVFFLFFFLWSFVYILICLIHFFHRQPVNITYIYVIVDCLDFRCIIFEELKFIVSVLTHTINIDFVI